MIRRLTAAVWLLLATSLLATALAACGDDESATEPISCAPDNGQSIAREWNETLLDAVRRDYPSPTVHARNLYHLSATMWDAWTAYDDAGTGVFYDGDHEVPEGSTLAAARHEAISYAAYTLLRRRYSGARGATASIVTFDELMARHCYSTAPSEDPDSPSAVGRLIAGSVIEQTIADGSRESFYYLSDYTPVNEPLAYEDSGTVLTDPNRWQPLEFRFAVPQFGLDRVGGVQTFTTPHWGSITPFAITGDPGLPIDPGAPPLLGDPATDDWFKEDVVEVIRAAAVLDPRSGVMVDASPGAYHESNPATGEPYAENELPLGDWARVIAEFWADGPDSETPPGHWNTLANDVSDHPDIELRIAGSGGEVDRLEWDVRLYLALNGALHDAAIAAWGAKAHYDTIRPISMIRHMGALGQSSDLGGTAFHPDGLPLVDGLVEVITAESAAPGERHEHLADHVGQVTVLSWTGPVDPAAATEITGVDWILPADWLPYQRDDFITPSFPGYVSGHSAFSRAGAEILTAFTGDPFFPGGLGEWTMPAGALGFEPGPSVDVTLQWGTYVEAADEAGLSRIYGGIHVPVDDVPGRLLGEACAEAAWDRVLDLWGLDGG